MGLEVLKNSTLIIPCVSIGNVPQLSVDLLIHNLGFNKISSLNDEFLYPFLSPVDHLPNANLNHQELSTGLEVYYSPKHNISLIQQRSPIIPGFVQLFSKQIKQFITDNDIKRVVVLDSGDLGLVDHTEENIEFYSNEDLSKSIESLNIKPGTDNVPINFKELDNQYKNSKLVKFLSNLELEVIVLAIYVYEGENFNEAIVLTDKLIQLLDIQPINWLRPISWKGVYGDKPIPITMEQGIFG